MEAYEWCTRKRSGAQVMCYTRKESNAQVNIHELEPKAQWTNYNINTFHIHIHVELQTVTVFRL